MLPQMTSHSWTSGSRQVITPSRLSGSRSFFAHFFCLFLPPLLNLFCFCWIHTVSVYCAHLCMKVPLVSLIFLKRSLVFPILLFPSISLHRSLRKAFLSLLAILWNSAFRWVYLSLSPLPFTSLLFLGICKDSSITLPCISFLWDNFGQHFLNIMNLYL